MNRAIARAVSVLVVAAGVAAAGPVSGAAARPGAATVAAATSRSEASAVNIPVNTWIARRLPGRGKAPWATIKHMRLAHNPLNGRIYFVGGDYSGPGGEYSGRMEVYSYSVVDNTWQLDHPYCGPEGSVQPRHPDQVGWAFDTKRSLFWMLPGYMGRDEEACPGVKLVDAIMTFDPATRKWSDPGRSNLGPNPGDKMFAQYDPVTDTIIRFATSGSDVVEIHDIAANRWTKRRFPSNGRLGKQYSAFDPEKRHLYVISAREARLYRYAIDAKELQAIADAPVTNKTAETRPVWDPVNRVLLWLEFGGFERTSGKFNVYHPDTGRWETNVPINQPDGLPVRGNNAVYDPTHHVMLVMGGTDAAKRSRDRVFNEHVFLYRYAPTGKSAAPDGPRRVGLGR